MADQLVKVTLRKSPIGYNRKVRDVLRGLGLRKMNQSVVRKDCPPIRGMIFKVKHLVEVEEGASPTVAKKPRVGKSKRTAPVKTKVAAEKPAEEKPAAKKKAAAKKPAEKKTAVKKTAAKKKSTAKKSPVRATPARKPQSEKN